MNTLYTKTKEYQCVIFHNEPSEVLYFCIKGADMATAASIFSNPEETSTIKIVSADGNAHKYDGFTRLAMLEQANSGIGIGMKKGVTA